MRYYASDRCPLIQSRAAGSLCSHLTLIMHARDVVKSVITESIGEREMQSSRLCCPVVELRQYTLHPGKRDVLIDLFDREFLETQEEVGMRIIGQFRDLLIIKIALFGSEVFVI